MMAALITANVYVFIKGDEEKTMFTATEAKVLVVDDIKTNLKVVNNFLDPYEMTVDMCLCGSDAIEMVKVEQYDLIFMDYRMPDMDGVEATKRIRAITDEGMNFTDLPIIALTADVVEGRKEMLIGNGFSDFMTKPIDADNLNNILEKWIPEHKKER